MSDVLPSATEGDVRPPWFADRPVLVLMYRVNRRPRAQGNLFTEQPASFMDHLAECLLFGSEVTTTGRGHERHWKLGNRDIDASETRIAGWIGFRAEDAEEQDDYDDATASWQSTVVATPRRATAPFAVVGDSRLLFVARHPQFAEGTLPVVFETLLTEGENARDHPTTDWAVEPVLDSGDFKQWLNSTAVLDQVTFTVKRPNPDAAESFAQLDQHLETMRVGTLTHRMSPADEESGLAKDFDQDPISQGLMEMARRSFARVRATGKSVSGSIRSYDQRRRVRREHVPMPGDHQGALDTLTQYAQSKQLEEDGDG
jgi:hypothetical protein